MAAQPVDYARLLRPPLPPGEGSRAAAGEGRRISEGTSVAQAIDRGYAYSPTTLTRPFGPPSPGGRGDLNAAGYREITLIEDVVKPSLLLKAGGPL